MVLKNGGKYLMTNARLGGTGSTADDCWIVGKQARIGSASDLNIFIWSANFSHSAYDKSEAKLKEIDVR